MRLFPQTYGALPVNDNDFSNMFESIPKCRYKGIVISIKDTEASPHEECSLSRLNISMYNGKKYIVTNQVGFKGSLCTGGGDSFSIVYDTAPKKGEEIYGIINKETGYIIRAGKIYFDTYPDIPLCEGQSYIFTLPKMLSFPEKISIGSGSIIVVGIFILFVKKYFKKSQLKK